MRRLFKPLWVLLAVIFLIEAWLWDHLEPVVERVVARIPLRAFKHWLAGKIGALSPALTLIVFVVPAVLLFPLKLLGLWLLSHEYWVGAISMMVFAKLLGVGVTAFIFDLTRPKLLQMQWFAKLYAWVLALRAKAAELVNPIKLRIREIMRSEGDGWLSRTRRLIQRFRKNAHQAR